MTIKLIEELHALLPGWGTALSPTVVQSQRRNAVALEQLRRLVSHPAVILVRRDAAAAIPEHHEPHTTMLGTTRAVSMGSGSQPGPKRYPRRRAAAPRVRAWVASGSS